MFRHNFCLKLTFKLHSQKFISKKCLHIINTVSDMQLLIKSLGTKTIGFVPTMGALHAGHISLVNFAKKENDIVVASIYVNPTQFSKNEDLDKYPRTLQKDVAMLELAGVDFLFCPTTNEMFPIDFNCYIEPKAFNTIVEGIARPDFFRGVATMVR